MKKSFSVFISFFALVLVFYYVLGYRQISSGIGYVFLLDDVYIHLALAKNFALNGAWSINETGFDSASSSILYTLILSFCIKIFGNWAFYPIIINIVFGFLTVYSVHRYFKDFYGKREWLISMIFLLPFTMLYTMVLIGMEHTLQMFLMVLMVYCVQKNVKTNFRNRDFFILLLVLFFLAMVRFESMFFTVSLAFAVFLRKNFGKSILILLVGFLPILVFGLISVQNGGFFFPNSVLVKGHYPANQNIFESLFGILKNGIFMNKSFYKYLLFPLILIFSYLIIYRKKNFKSFLDETLIITIVATALLHSLFAVLEFRYENYLMIALLMVFVPMISAFLRDFSFNRIKFKQIIPLVAIAGIALLSVYRMVYIHSYLKLASKNISEQQLEMSRFLHQFYKNEKVVANDIGAIAYFSEVQLLDVVGLGSTEVAEIKYQNRNNSKEIRDKNYTEFIKSYTLKNQYKVAVIYPEWFPNRKVPSNWIPVASWTLQGVNKGTAIKRVVFFALNESEVKPLQQNLQKFNLNKNVVQYFYTLK